MSELTLTHITRDAVRLCTSKPRRNLPNHSSRMTACAHMLIFACCFKYSNACPSRWSLSEAYRVGHKQIVEEARDVLRASAVIIRKRLAEATLADAAAAAAGSGGAAASGNWASASAAAPAAAAGSAMAAAEAAAGRGAVGSDTAAAAAAGAPSAPATTGTTAAASSGEQGASSDGARRTTAHERKRPKARGADRHTDGDGFRGQVRPPAVWGLGGRAG